LTHVMLCSGERSRRKAGNCSENLRKYPGAKWAMPSDESSIPSCDFLVQQIDRWFNVLRQCGVDVLASTANCFVRCPVCNSGRPSKKRECKGGSLRIDTNTPIRFVSNHGGRSVRITVTAATQWSDSSSPFPNKHNVEVEVSIEDEPLKYKAHLDLATNFRQEPLFHLQAGGLRTEKSPAEKYLGLLRWPMIPLDLILVTELILYTFQHEEWEAVHQNAEFLQAVRQSEELFLAPFFKKFWRQPTDRGHSFLAAFCASRQSGPQIRTLGRSKTRKRK
jgi:hypothetical protein